MTSAGAHHRLLAGPAFAAGAEGFADHIGRLGPVPMADARGGLIPTLEASGLLGRGGAGFPVGRKWRTVAEHSNDDAVVLANGAEGEPLSAKDRALMTLRPHLVIDGALLATRAVGADAIILYVGAGHTAARASLRRALAQRSDVNGVSVDIVDAPDRYVAGEESAAVHFVNERDARPTSIPPRPFECGVADRPTLVQNVESLAAVALIARYGDGWYRDVGRAVTRGTALVTVAGAPRSGVREIELGTTVAELAAETGVDPRGVQAALIGGYFGRWHPMREAFDIALDPAQMRADGQTFGCGVVSFLPADVCGVAATAQIAEYLAGQSAAQCGPCVFGLRSVADALHRLAGRSADGDDLARVERWAGQLAGRGACRHPDGAAGLVLSSLHTFGAEYTRHQIGRTCGFLRSAVVAA